MFLTSCARMLDILIDPSIFKLDVDSNSESPKESAMRTVRRIAAVALLSFTGLVVATGTVLAYNNIDFNMLRQLLEIIFRPVSA